MESLREKINSISPLPDAIMEAFLPAWNHWLLPRNGVLLREHAVSDYLYFIEKGSARIYYHKGDKEVTEWLALDGEFFLSITSYFNRTPSHLAIETIEPSEVYGIHHHDFMRLADEHHAVERLLRKMVTASLMLSQTRMEAIQFESAQQRYERMLRDQPRIVQRIPLTYIASFLGITLETLSRIRSAH